MEVVHLQQMSQCEQEVKSVR